MKEMLSANLRFHGRRYFATSLAVGIATIFVVIMLSFGNALGAGLKLSYMEQYQGATTVVGWVPTDAEFEPSTDVMEQIAALPEVSAVEPIISVYATFEANGSENSGSIEPLRPEPFYTPKLSEGQLPAGVNEIAMDRVVAKALGVKVGDQVDSYRYLSVDDLEVMSLKVVGLLGENTAFNMSQGPAAVMTPEGFDLFAQDLVAEGFLIVNTGNIVEQLNEILPPQYFAQTTDEKLEEMLNEVDASTTQIKLMLGIFPAIAVVVALIVVTTTFQVIVQQRQRELGLLRCLGATRKQTRNLILGESFLVGAISSLIGVVVSTLLAALGITLLGVLPSFGAALAAVGLPTVIGVFIGGVLLTVIAGYRSARRASRLSPLVAFVTSADTPPRRVPWVRLVLGGAVLVVSTIGMVVFAKDSPNSTSIGIAMVCGVVSLLSATIFLSAAFPTFVRWLALPWRGTLARLAVGNTQRNPGRTAATGVSIFIGVSLMVMMLVAGTSMQATANAELDQRVPVDVTVAGMEFTTAQVEEIAALPHVEAVSIRQTLSEGVMLGDWEMSVAELDSTNLVARTPVTPPKGNVVLVPPGRFSISADGEDVGLDEGSPADLCYNDVCEVVTIEYVGLWDPTVWVSSDLIAELGLPMQDTMVLVRLDSPANSKIVETEIQRLNPDYEIGGASQLRQQTDSVVNTIMIVGAALLGVSVLVALVGVSNTLSLSVVERTRENGLLRALGMTRRQVSRMLTAEAVFISVAAALTGVILGGIIGWGAALTLSGFGEVVLAIPWWQIGVVLVASLVAAVVASWLPGRRAGRTSPIEALA